MQALLNLTTDAQGASVVSARELYEFLGFDLSQWARWSRKNIVSNPFGLEGTDWQQLDMMSRRGNGAQVEIKDYALSLDFAERLCMLARTEKGEGVRRWFQAIRDKVVALQESATVKPLHSSAKSLDKPTADLLLQQGQLLDQQQQTIEYLQEQVNQLMSGFRPAKQVQPSLCRQSVVRRVNHYANLSNVSAQEVYTWLYKRLQQVYGIDLRSLSRRAGESLLDVADRYDYLHRLLGLIEAELNYIEE